MNNYVDIDVNKLEGYTDDEIISLIEGIEKRIEECQDIINNQENKYDDCPESAEKYKLEQILKGLNDELMIRGNTGSGEGSDGEPKCEEGETEDDEDPECKCPDDGDDPLPCTCPEDGDDIICTRPDDGGDDIENDNDKIEGCDIKGEEDDDVVVCECPDDGDDDATCDAENPECDEYDNKECNEGETESDCQELETDGICAEGETEDDDEDEHPECDGSASGVDGDDEPDCDTNNACDEEDIPEDDKDEDEKPTESDKKTFKLSEALKQNDIIQEIKIIGWYTGADKNKVSKYTENRCKVIKEWLKKHFNSDNINISYKHGGDEPNEMYNENAVKSRRVDVYVVYKGEAIDKGSSGDNKKDAKKEDKPSVMYDYSTENDGFSVYNEAEYFSTLSETDAVAHQLIKDKIKNFNPAFHSITPEGFAMRLNFLHGCTRQGPTLEGNQSNNVATNLAFGRPPVCVLRIGDFINTRMIIRTLSINYESGSGIQWDLNPEGAGIQPMFAKVQMGIDLIGGQSLEGPVRQLNNALNGLHYANSGIINGKKKVKL